MIRFAWEYFLRAGEYINANDIIAFCLCVMNKMRENLIKIRSCVIFRWTNQLDSFSSYFQFDNETNTLNGQ